MAVVVINIQKQNQQQLQNVSPNSIPSKRRKSSGYMYTRSWYHDEGVRTIPDRANYCRYTDEEMTYFLVSRESRSGDGV